MTVYNFSAGPAVLPKPVLERAKEELLSWHGSEMSVMEMSHRGPEFISILEKAEADLRELLHIPQGYKVLFLQGGASLQFSMAPLNLLPEGGHAAYVLSGSWSKKAIDEASRFGEVCLAASSKEQKFTAAPHPSTWQVPPQAAYLHYTPNETIEGVEFFEVPTLDSPLVADMSSMILSRPLPVEKFSLIYAGAQKNIGPAGLCLVIVKEELLGHARPGIPTMLDYQVHAQAQSCYNTPPTFAIYIAGLVFEWLKGQGGLAAMEEINRAKAQMLYNYIDSSGFYENRVEKSSRSRMNVPFWLKNPSLEKIFLEEAEAAGFLQLKGHRSVGGMRASLYNAMPMEGVLALIDFMKEFCRRHG